MIAEQRCVVDLGPVQVAVITDVADVIRCLADFYPLRRNGEAQWAVEAHLGSPAAEMALTPWKVGYHADRGARRVVIQATNPRNLAATTRKAVREVLLDYCATHHYTMLHASAVVGDQNVIVVVGDEGSGKTTLALDGALGGGYRYLSNDHLILYRPQGALVATSLPTPIPIKIGTYLDFADLLGEPWENGGPDIDSFRNIPRQQCYGYDRCLFYTYRGIGHTSPLHAELAGLRVIVVLADYAPAHAPAADPTLVDDPVAALWPHVRFEWEFNSEVNTHYVPRAQRSRSVYARDSRERLTELGSRALVVRWRHHGRLAPLLNWLQRGPGGAR